jgi:hypothetical protein
MLNEAEYTTNKLRLEALNQEIEERRALTKTRTSLRRKIKKEIDAHERKVKKQAKV